MNRESIARAVGRAVRHARTIRNVSQADLAERTGLARTNIVRLEKGRHLPRLDVIATIANALGVRPTILLASIDRAGATNTTNETDTNERRKP